MKNLLRKVEGNIYGLGVYCFKDIDGKILYVGSGMMNDRLQTHLYNLKRGLYEDTNKKVLQHTYNCGNLSFEVLHLSENNSEYINGTDKERMAIQEALEVMEQFYVDLYKDTICNKMRRITKWSSSPNKMSTYKRKMANRGNKNPNCKYSEEQICNILYLKENGLRNKDIEEIAKKELNVKINRNYINDIGKTKWIHIKGKYEKWMDKYI